MSDQKHYDNALCPSPTWRPVFPGLWVMAGVLLSTLGWVWGCWCQELPPTIPEAAHGLSACHDHAFLPLSGSLTLLERVGREEICFSAMFLLSGYVSLCLYSTMSRLWLQNERKTERWSYLPCLLYHSVITNHTVHGKEKQKWNNIIKEVCAWRSFLHRGW